MKQQRLVQNVKWPLLTPEDINVIILPVRALISGVMSVGEILIDVVVSFKAQAMVESEMDK